jgi:hypothetical protein
MKRKEEERKRFIVRFLFGIFIIGSLLWAVDFSQAYSNESIEAKICLNESLQIIYDMGGAGFNTIRVNDTYYLAEQTYLSQIVAEDKNQFGEYRTILEKCKQIKDIKIKALQNKDELRVLEERINETSKNKDANLTEVLESFKRASQEFYDERYEQSLVLIEETYQKISEAESSAAQAKVFYVAASKTLGNFFIKSWWIILIVIVVLLAIYFITKSRIEKFLIKRRIKRLGIEEKVLKDLIAKTQKDYFEKGIVSEGNYNIKMKKFSELIRDIHREVPLLKEELEKREARIEDDDKKD